MGTSTDDEVRSEFSLLRAQLKNDLGVYGQLLPRSEGNVSTRGKRQDA